jgi:GNAT superfamily N-acetyltransferase
MFHLDKSVDESRLAQFLVAFGASLPAEVFPEVWYLQTLAVDPTCQRRGVGSLLVNWGLEHARAEGIPAALESSSKGRLMYEKLGFRLLEVLEWLGDWKIPVLVWHSSGEYEEGSWFERVKREIDAYRSR